MPTIDGTDNFNHAITAPTFYDNVFGTPSSVSTPLYQSQPASLLVPSDGANQGVRKNTTGTPDRPWLGFAFRTESLPASGLIHLCALHPSGAGNDEMRIYLDSAGALKAFFTGGGTVVGSTTYTAGNWIWIEAIANFTATTYNGFWRVNGVDQTSPTKAGEGVTTSDYTQLISYSGDATRDWYAAYWHWGRATSDSDFLGEPSAFGRFYRRMAGPRQLTTSAATVYTVPVGKLGVARRIWVNNPSGSPVGVTISIGADAAGTRIIADDTIAAGDVLDISAEFTLAATEVIQAYADTASTAVLMIDGYEESYFG